MYVADVPGIEPRTGAIAGPEPACARLDRREGPRRARSGRAAWLAAPRGPRPRCRCRSRRRAWRSSACGCRLRDVAAGRGLVVDARGDRAERGGDRRRAARGGGSGRCGRCCRGVDGARRGRGRARGGGKLVPRRAQPLAASCVGGPRQPQPTSAGEPGLGGARRVPAPRFFFGERSTCEPTIDRLSQVLPVMA